MPAHDENKREYGVELEILSRDSSARFRAPSKQQSRQRGTVLGISEFGSDYLSNVNTCVYEPSAFRVLVTWPRAPMYLPVPPKTGRTTGWPASNSGADGE